LKVADPIMTFLSEPSATVTMSICESYIGSGRSRGR